MKNEYIEFLKQKIYVAPETGLNVEVPLMKFKDGTQLLPHQRDAINWAIRGGRRALFESFGLGKTIQQLIICQTVIKEKGGKALIIAPLGVRQEFRKDAERKLGVTIHYVKSNEEVKALPDGTICITNYERVRDCGLDPQLFTVTSLDEASVLRSYGSKTYQTFLDKFKGIQFKYVCTATPSPNKYKELIHYAGYLEVMDTGQALTRFFKRDSTKANNLKIYPHKEKEFWLWMSTWALFITKPSDLGYSDEGYDLPEMEIHYHCVNVNHGTAGTDEDGQVKMFREAALGLKEAAKEKRDSLPGRIKKMREIIDSDPNSHYIIWHDLEKERHEIMKELKGYDIAQVYGSQDLDKREQTIVDFSEGEIQYLATKPTISGQGCNFQYHCHKAIFLGIGYEFNDFIQAIHRIYRFQQKQQVEIHIIYAESETEILKVLLKKWEQHKYLVEQMTNIIKESGLSSVNVEQKLLRTLGIERDEERGKLYHAIQNDCVLETQTMEDNSVGLIVTSIPFANHYEYTPTYNDFGHTDDNEHFFEQIDFLTPELFRILQPGRVACIHVKDRILFGNATGDGMPTLDPFSDMTVFHFIKHGFRYMGRITIETDVVRENNQTYRLGWGENNKDGTKMGVGCPEYVLLFRKLPSDTSKAYADVRVEKSETDYKLGQWQIDARAKWNSSGNRFLTSEELRTYPIDKIGRYFKNFLQDEIYDYDKHVDVANELNGMEKLPKTFQTLNVPARSMWVWDDVNRMLTLNGSQSKRNLEFHICPLQFDIVDRCINRYSNKGDVVFDPFGGLMTVPYRAMLMGRFGIATELNPVSYRDGLFYLRKAESELEMPTLFSLEEIAI